MLHLGHLKKFPINETIYASPAVFLLLIVTIRCNIWVKFAALCFVDGYSFIFSKNFLPYMQISFGYKHEYKYTYLFLICSLYCTHRMDYCGIIVLIVSSFPPWVNYCFYCDWSIKTVYLIAVSSLGAICIYFVVDEKFSSKEYRPIRAGTAHFI